MQQQIVGIPVVVAVAVSVLVALLAIYAVVSALPELVPVGVAVTALNVATIPKLAIVKTP